MDNRSKMVATAMAGGFLWASTGIAVGATLSDILVPAIAASLICGAWLGAGVADTPYTPKNQVLAAGAIALGILISIGFLVILPAWTIPATMGAGAVALMVWQIRKLRVS